MESKAENFTSFLAKNVPCEPFKAIIRLRTNWKVARYTRALSDMCSHEPKTRKLLKIFARILLTKESWHVEKSIFHFVFRAPATCNVFFSLFQIITERHIYRDTDKRADFPKTDKNTWSFKEISRRKYLHFFSRNFFLLEMVQHQTFALFLISLSFRSLTAYLFHSDPKISNIHSAISYKYS